MKKSALSYIPNANLSFLASRDDKMMLAGMEKCCCSSFMTAITIFDGFFLQKMR